MSPQLRRVALWSALVLLAALYVQRNVVAAAGHLGSSPSDFHNYWAAAVAWVDGSSPYAVHNFDYPPLTAVVVLPLAAIDYPTARFVWFVVCQLLLLLAGLVVWRSLGRGLTAGLAVAAVWTLAGTVAANLVLGQINPLLLLLVAAAATALARARDLPAGAALGLAAALKVWPGAVLWSAAVGRRWRALGAGVLVAVLGVGVPLLAIAVGRPPPHRPTSSGFWAGTPAFLNLSLPATALRLADPPGPDDEMPRSWRLGNNPEQFQLDGGGAVLSLAISAAALAFGFAWVARAQTSTTPWPAALGAAIAVTLAAAPVSWYHYRLLHFPALAWLLTTLVRRRQWGATIVLVPLTVVLTWSHALHGEGAWSVPLEPWSVLVRGAVVPLAELGLAWWLLRAGDSPPTHTPSPDAGAGDTAVPDSPLVS